MYSSGPWETSRRPAPYANAGMPSWAYQRVSSTPGQSSKRGGPPSTVSTQRASARRPGARVVAAGWLPLEDIDATPAPMRAAASSIVPVSRATSSSSSSSGLKRRSTENHAAPGTTLKFAPLPDGAADDEHRPARLFAFQRVVRAAREQLVREVGERLGDLHHLLERVDAEMRLPDVRLRGPPPRRAA